MNLIFRLGHVIEQEFQNHSAAETSAFDFEIRKAYGEVSVLNVLDANKARIGHGFGEPIALIATGRGTMVIFAVFSQILSADILIAVFSLGAAEPAAFVAQKFHLERLVLGVKRFRINSESLLSFSYAYCTMKCGHFQCETPAFHYISGNSGYCYNIP